MKKIKNAFGRFYLNHPKKVLSFGYIACCILFVFCGFAINFWYNRVFSETFSKTLIFLFLGGFFFFLVLLFFLYFSSDWAKELPEYVISEAQKILESNVVSPKLESLVEQVKTSKGENGLNELKNWLELFEDYKSLKKNLPQLQKQQDEITTKISESMEKRNQLRMDLLIA